MSRFFLLVFATSKIRSVMLGVALVCFTHVTAATIPDDPGLLFTHNKGQAHADWEFTARSGKLSVAVNGRFLALFPQNSRLVGIGSEGDLAQPESKPPAVSPMILEFIGGRKDVVGVGEQPHTSVSHFLLGNDPAGWHRNVANFNVIRYANLYEGIDLVYRNDNHRVRYDFELEPGADVGLIAIRLVDDRPIELADNGALILQGSSGQLIQYAPKVFSRSSDGSMVPVPAIYQITENNTVTFDVADFPDDQELIIDPTIEFSTLIGGSQSDVVDALASTNTGLVVVGRTTSMDFPILNDSQPSLTPSINNSNIFISKYSPDSSELLFSTHLGGSNFELVAGVLEASNGDLILVGSTSSPDFPTPNGFDTTFAGGDRINQDAFVTRLNSDGSDFVFSMYVGGFDQQIDYDPIDRFGRETIRDAYLDRETGSLYLIGNTGSSDFPVTDLFLGRGCFENSGIGQFSFRTDAFVMLMDAQNGAIYKSFCFGGEGRTAGRGIIVDKDRSAVFVSGYTTSPDFPATPDSYQPQLAGGSGDTDGFLARFDLDLTTLEAATYFGGTGYDLGLRMRLDSQSRPLLAGLSQSVDLPTTPGVFQENNEAIDDIAVFGQSGFIAALSRDLSINRFASYLGAKGSTSIINFQLDSQDRIYMFGSTDAAAFPLAGQIQATRGSYVSRPRQTVAPVDDLQVNAMVIGDSGLIDQSGITFYRPFAVLARQRVDGSPASNLLLRRSGGLFTPIAELSGIPYASSAAVVTNLSSSTSNRATDFIIGNCNGPHRVYQGDDSGGFDLTDEVASPITCVTSMEVIRVDNDSFLDLVVTDGVSMYYHAGDGSGGFGPAVELPVFVNEIGQIKRLPANYSFSGTGLIVTDRAGPDKLINFTIDPPEEYLLFDGDPRSTRWVGYSRSFNNSTAMVFAYESGMNRLTTSATLFSGDTEIFGNPMRRLDGLASNSGTSFNVPMLTLETDSGGVQSIHSYDYKEDSTVLEEVISDKLTLEGARVEFPQSMIWSNSLSGALFQRDGGKISEMSLSATDNVISVLDKDASELLFSSYLGGGGADSSQWAIDLPRDGKINLGGGTFDDGFPLVSPLQTLATGMSQTGFVTIISIDDLLDDDADFVMNDVDNCTRVENPSQIDSDLDGYGNACDGDFNQDQSVNFLDLIRLLNAFDSDDDLITDLNADGITNFLDLSIFTQLFQRPPGPGATDLQ